MKAKHAVILVLLAVVLAAALFLGMKAAGFYKEYKNNITTEGRDVEVTIDKGSTVKQVASVLKSAGLIKYERAFVMRAKESAYGDQLRYGDFILNTGMCIEDMLKVIAEGGHDNAAVKVVIPEGYSVEMIAARIAKTGLCTEEAFLEAVKQDDYDYSFLEEIPKDKKIKYRLQGFLFPATYEFTQGTTPHDMVNQMLKAFNNNVSTDDFAAAKEINRSFYEIITIASIVEREAKLAEERPLIAGVVYNRLDIDMKLQMCPTVLYATTDGMYNVNQVLYKDLTIDSPYNTYKNAGLPVGPICNPGIASIRAALYPEKSEYLFYHTDDEKKGSHIFSKTYQEHEDSRIKK